MSAYWNGNSTAATNYPGGFGRVWVRLVVQVQPPPLPPPPHADILAALALLGLTAPTTREAVREAYRAKALEAHPDRGGSHEAMVALNEARELLIGQPGGAP